MKATDQRSRLTVPRRVRKVHFVSMETLQQKRQAALAEQLLDTARLIKGLHIRN